MPCECEIIRSENNEVSDQSNSSYDQLWAASLTGQNAVTWRWSLSNDQRVTVDRKAVTRGCLNTP